MNAVAQMELVVAAHPFVAKVVRLLSLGSTVVAKAKSELPYLFVLNAQRRA